jgi:hypothetical protein
VNRDQELLGEIYMFIQNDELILNEGVISDWFKNMLQKKGINSKLSQWFVAYLTSQNLIQRLIGTDKNQINKNIPRDQFVSYTNTVNTSQSDPTKTNHEKISKQASSSSYEDQMTGGYYGTSNNRKLSFWAIWFVDMFYEVSKLYLSAFILHAPVMSSGDYDKGIEMMQNRFSTVAQSKPDTKVQSVLNNISNKVEEASKTGGEQAKDIAIKTALDSISTLLNSKSNEKLTPQQCLQNLQQLGYFKDWKYNS